MAEPFQYPSSKADLLIYSGLIALEYETKLADILVDQGKIVSIHEPSYVTRAKREINTSGKIAMLL
ncbi:hypothetical protein [Pelagibaculum spongiae]|uniref:Uncharacterized protein n=1 Tax=Pelagibaculum spongiae TaxID=2080658 RepID=A0A2V1GZM9_9GAMM|nr:hypothetical protein [Pelagibaculum spongiae]PVZ67589.1 hypothetical protein DC094_14210 [Pelagibaculum spongiae]